MASGGGRFGGWAARHAASLLLLAAIASLALLLLHRGTDLLQPFGDVTGRPDGEVVAARDPGPVPGWVPPAPPAPLEPQAPVEEEKNAPAFQDQYLLQQQQLVLPQEQYMVDDIRRNYLHPPSFEPYELKENLKKDPSRGQSRVILEALRNMRNGFFVECGALDGETRSNTLFMERFLGWTGLLVEADPSNFQKVLTKRRNAWSVNVCLNNKNDKSKVSFKPAFNIGKIASANASGTVEVDCFPLHALLLALNVTRVDYFSLDVEGAELDVLRTVPFDRIDIRTLSVEFAHTTGGGKPALREFMEAKGYTIIREVKQRDWTANDFIFVKNDTFSEEERLRLSAPYRVA